MHLRSACSASGAVLGAGDTAITRSLPRRSTRFSRGRRRTRALPPSSLQPRKALVRKVQMLPFKRERTDSPEIPLSYLQVFCLSQLGLLAFAPRLYSPTLSQACPLPPSPILLGFQLAASITFPTPASPHLSALQCYNPCAHPSAPSPLLLTSRSLTTKA